MEGLSPHLPHSHAFNLVPLCSLRFLFLVLTISISISCLASSGGACEKPFQCGKNFFGYPFGRKNSGCGDPALQLDCDDEMPSLNIGGFQYYVLQHFLRHEYIVIKYINITIVEKNLWGQGRCNLLSGNQTAQFWSSPKFHIVDGYENTTLWGDCAKENANLLEKATKLECNNDWYYNMSSDLSWTPLCKLQVQVPVNISDIRALWLNPSEILREGFQIRWTVTESCQQCELSWGLCGYNSSTDFYCNCSGTVYPEKCPTAEPPKSAIKQKTINIIIGSFFGGAGLVAVVVLLLIYYAKRRKVPPTGGLASDFSNYHRNDMEAGRSRYMVGNLSIFPYQELQLATNFFDEKNELGDGGFGAVYLGKLQDGRVVAVKRLHQENSRRVEQFINEVQILSSLSHPNLVRLYGCTCPQSPVLLLVYEFVSNGTLADHLHGSRRTLRGLSWGTRLNIAIETAQALAYLHSIDPPIFHRDVKSNNILVDEHFRAKVADFGLSRLVPVNVSHVTTAPQGTPGYLDPEYHQCFQLTEKSDVYSFGVVLVEIVSAKVAVDITRNRNEISLANMAIGKIRRGVWDELVDPDLKIEQNHEVKAMVGAVAELAFQCLARERESRPGMKEVVSTLEEIKQLQESNGSTKVISITPTASQTSVQENWANMAWDQRA